MSSQGDDWTDKLIREAIGNATQEQIEEVIAILSKSAREIRTNAGWPSRFHLFRPGEYMVDGRPWEEYIVGLLVPVRGPVDLWRRGVRLAADLNRPDE